MVFDKFKDTLDATKVSSIVRDSLLSHIENVQVSSVPISDGGDGFVECMKQLLPSSRRVEVPILDPLMRETKSHCIIQDDTAYIEVANSAGL